MSPFVPSEVEGPLNARDRRVSTALDTNEKMSRLLVLGLAWSLFAGQAAAQSCIIPSEVPLPTLPDQGGETRIAVPVTGYLFALSWSPEFCRTRGEERRHRLQCSGEAGRFGFILHGLWPDGEGRRDPRWCRTVPVPDKMTIRAHLCMTPSANLLAHEWAKHGSCAFGDAPRYFRAGATMFNALRFPDMNALSRREPTAADIRQSFAELNRGVPADAVAIVANRRQWLQEVRLCLGRDFRPRSCSPEDRGVAGAVPVRIWRGR